MQMVGSSFGHHKRSEYLRSKVGLQVVGLLRGVGVEKGLLFCFDGRCRVLFKVGASESILIFWCTSLILSLLMGKLVEY